MGLHVGILLDLQGPKISLGTFGAAAARSNGSEFRITTEQVVGTCARASTTYKDFVKDVKPGNQVLLADGSVELRVFRSQIPMPFAKWSAAGRFPIARGSICLASKSVRRR